MKILNLYAGIGGNRKLWEGVEVTAVEIDSEIAQVYTDRFPNDTMIIGDAHDFLLQHYKEFDFIWGSPPCPTHSKIRKVGVITGHNAAKYPDMKLWQEIIFLMHHAKGKWLIENVIPYYQPLIPGKKIGRHLFWSNFALNEIATTADNVKNGTNKQREDKTGLSIDGYTFKNVRRDKIMRNCVDPEIGLHILNIARNIMTKQNVNQTTIFDDHH